MEAKSSGCWPTSRKRSGFSAGRRASRSKTDCRGPSSGSVRTWRDTGPAPTSYKPAMKPAFEIAGRRIGTGSRCFVIAEAGVNHNGDLTRALELVDVAAE